MRTTSGKTTVENSHGSVSIEPRVIFSLAFTAAVGTYGVVGIASRYTGDDCTHTDPERGIEIEHAPSQDLRMHVRIVLHVIVEYGVQLRSVASRLQHQVSFAIQRSTGYVVDGVHVHITSLRVTHVD